MKDISLPLFLNFEELLDIYVIDNEVFGCIRGDFRYSHPNRAFELLHKLFSSPVARESSPSSLNKHFKMNPFPRLIQPRKCLLGSDDFEGYGGLFFCLELQLSIQPDNFLPILLHDFVFEGLSLDYRIELSPSDAFMIFSNISVNRIVESFNSYTTNSEKKKYNRALIPQKYFTHSYYKSIALYCADYIDYLYNCLTENLLTPLDLLRNCGTNILVLFSSLEPVKSFIDQMLVQLQNPSLLSKNHKIIYYTLLRSLLSSDLLIFTKIKRFFANNSHIIEQLKTEIEKPFPHHRDIYREDNYNQW